MDIFTPNAFIGNAQIEGQRETFWAMLKQAKQIRIKLGEQGYLVDRYLEYLLEGANAKAAAVATEEGHEAANELIAMCRKCMAGEDVAISTPAYANIKEYIAKNPLPYKDLNTVVSEHFVRLTHDYLVDFCKQYADDFDAIYQHVECKSCYDKMAQILGSEEELKALNDLFVQCFGQMKIMDLLISGYHYELINALTYRDKEAERTVFQFILDSIEG